MLFVWGFDYVPQALLICFIQAHISASKMIMLRSQFVSIDRLIQLRNFKESQRFVSDPKEKEIMLAEKKSVGKESWQKAN